MTPSSTCKGANPTDCHCYQEVVLQCKCVLPMNTYIEIAMNELSASGADNYVINAINSISEGKQFILSNKANENKQLVPTNN